MKKKKKTVGKSRQSNSLAEVTQVIAPEGRVLVYPAREFRFVAGMKCRIHPLILSQFSKFFSR